MFGRLSKWAKDGGLRGFVYVLWGVLSGLAKSIKHLCTDTCENNDCGFERGFFGALSF